MSAARHQDADFAAERAAMVALLRDRGIRDERVLDAMAAVPREDFLPRRQRARAYEDAAVGIGRQATLSQPYVTAVMLDALGLRGGERVLEIGMGSGYVTALLARLDAQVWSLEIDPVLHEVAAGRLASSAGIALRLGDGTLGWPESAPFDACLAAAAVDEVPPAWLEQLRPGGRLVAPVGPTGHQQLLLVERPPEGPADTCTTPLLPVRFVSLRS